MGNPVLVFGAFETGHWGQTEFLDRASEYGPITVGLSTDRFLEDTKRKPLYPYKVRRSHLERRGYEVIPRDEDDVSDIFRKVRPAYYVCGNDWLDPAARHLLRSGLSVSLLNELEVTVIYTPRPDSISTTDIIERVRRSP